MEDISDSESYFSADSLDFKDKKLIQTKKQDNIKEIEVVPFYSGNVPVSCVRKLQKRSKSTSFNKNCASKQNSDVTLDLNSPNITSSLDVFKQHCVSKNKIPVKPKKPTGSYLGQYQKRLTSSAVKSHDSVSLCTVVDDMSTYTFSDPEDVSASPKTSYTDSELEYYEEILYKCNENNPNGVDKSIYTLPTVQPKHVAKKESKRRSNISHTTSESPKDTIDVNKQKMYLQKRQEYGHAVSRRNVEMILSKKEQNYLRTFAAYPSLQLNADDEDCFTKKINVDDLSSNSKLDQKQINNQRNATMKKNNVRSTVRSGNNKTDCFNYELSNLQKRHEEDRKRIEKIRNELRR